MSNVVSWNLRLSINEGRLEDFRSLMEEMVQATQAESGTLSYEWFISSDEASCHVHERYADSDAALAHLGKFGSDFAERFLACAQPTALCVYGEPSDETRSVLDGFGAVYMATFGGFSR